MSMNMVAICDMLRKQAQTESESRTGGKLAKAMRTQLGDMENGDQVLGYRSFVQTACPMARTRLDTA
eukprot:CAMPEP_0174698618 /NCGR_PEP_ID=MMETSP1094-20130205/4159_1 /TAXON_ID=156173 /ORGANISM="Chrysochromulina brevifilum, Strain UTEX LB 985" /LENGTH=66 /DNA_ID=CAMNT_0015895823 /DNA_START=107 /DNA_END=303 /DNA_ORIENTATION=+